MSSEVAGAADEDAAEALAGALCTKIFGFRVQGGDGAGAGKEAGDERHRIGCAAHLLEPARYIGGRDIGPRRGVIEMKGPARLYQRAVPGIDPGHRDPTLIGGRERGRRGGPVIAYGGDDAGDARQPLPAGPCPERSEERRVGQGSDRTGRYRGSLY